MTDKMTEESVLAAFQHLGECLARGDIEGFLATFDDAAVIFEEDTPFRMNKSQFGDHLRRLTAHVSFEAVPHDMVCVVRGQTGVVAGYFTSWVKPTDGPLERWPARFTITFACQRRANSTTSSQKTSTSTFGSSVSASSRKPTRSSRLKSGFLCCGVPTTPTTIRSKIADARLITSTWPKVTGS